MLIIFANLLCWIPAVFGFGIISVVLRDRISTTRSNDFDMITEPVFGMFCLSLLGSFLNFFVPIDPVVSVMILFAGWTLCWLRLRRIGTFQITFRTASLLFLWLLFVSFWASQPPRNVDSGLYHMQAIQWLNKSVLPLGLANLHDRFGINSAWFSIAAMIQLPGKSTEGVNSFSMSALMIYFFGIAVYRSSKAKPETNFAVYFSLTALLFLSDSLRRNISSPSPDLGVQFLCVILTGLAIQGFETRSEWTSRIFQMIGIAIFGTMVKSSSAPLLLFPLSMLLFAWRNGIFIAWVRLTSYTVVLIGMAFSVWTARSIALSGCLNFPISQSCFYDLRWSVSRHTVEHQWSAYKTSAKLTYPEDLPMSEWFDLWFTGTLQSVDFVIPCGLILIGSCVYFFRRKNFSFQPAWLGVPLLIALVLWFLTAPAIRFASGYFWSLGLFVVSGGIASLATNRQRRIAMAGIILSAVVLFTLLLKFTYVGFPPIKKAARDPRAVFLQLPIPQHPTTTRITFEGVPINVPVDQDCWLSELPCTPYFNEDLRTIRSPDGGFKMFYHPK